MFGPALYQAQIRLSLSIGFTYLSIFLFRRSQSFLATIMISLSILSHSTAILFSPLTVFLAFANNIDSYLKLLVSQARAKKIILFAFSILILCIVIVLFVLAPRYLASESNQFQLGQASGSLLYDLVTSFVIFFLFQFSLNSNFAMRLAYSLNYLPSYLLHHIVSGTILLGFIGWLGRFKFWFYPYISLAIANNYKTLLLPVVVLFTLRNLRLYFIVDSSYMIFLF